MEAAGGREGQEGGAGAFILFQEWDALGLWDEAGAVHSRPVRGVLVSAKEVLSGLGHIG